MHECRYGKSCPTYCTPLLYPKPVSHFTAFSYGYYEDWAISHKTEMNSLFAEPPGVSKSNNKHISPLIVG